MAIAALTSLARWALMLGAAELVKHGIWTAGDASSYVAAGAVAIVSLGWSQWDKYKSLVTINTLCMFAKTTLEAVRAHISTPGVVVPTVTTPANTVPGVPK